MIGKYPAALRTTNNVKQLSEHRERYFYGFSGEVRVEDEVPSILSLIGLEFVQRKLGISLVGLGTLVYNVFRIILGLAVLTPRKSFIHKTAVIIYVCKPALYDQTKNVGEYRNNCHNINYYRNRH